MNNLNEKEKKNETLTNKEEKKQTQEKIQAGFNDGDLPLTPLFLSRWQCFHHTTQNSRGTGRLQNS